MLLVFSFQYVTYTTITCFHAVPQTGWFCHGFIPVTNAYLDHEFRAHIPEGVQARLSQAADPAVGAEQQEPARTTNV